MLSVSDAWRETYPGALAGFLAMRDVDNPDHSAALDERKAALEAELRSRFSGVERAALASAFPLREYAAYFRGFKKTYHVQLQLESLVNKGRGIPRVAALVEAMFMAEMKNLLLTAGHDLDSLRTPVVADVAKGDESYVAMSGRPQATKQGDLLMADGEGIVSTVLYGPDGRTRITSSTKSVLFTVYGVPGIGEEAIEDHLADMEANVRIVCPDARTESMVVLPGD